MTDGELRLNSDLAAALAAVFAVEQPVVTDRAASDPGASITARLHEQNEQGDDDRDRRAGQKFATKISCELNGTHLIEPVGDEHHVGEQEDDANHSENDYFSDPKGHDEPPFRHYRHNQHSAL